MVNVYTRFSHNFLQIAIGTGIADIEENGIEDGAFRKVDPFEINSHPRCLHSIMLNVHE